MAFNVNFCVHVLEPFHAWLNYTRGNKYRPKAGENETFSEIIFPFSNCHICGSVQQNKHVLYEMKAKKAHFSLIIVSSILYVICVN